MRVCQSDVARQPHRLVRDRAGVWQKVAKLDAGLAVLFPTRDSRQQGTILLPGRHGREALPHLDRGREFFTDPFVKLRLVIEEIDMRRRSTLHEVDDPLGFRFEVRSAR